MNVTSYNEVLKDMYPLPGTRVKQWVVDMRRESAWERETCPRVQVFGHPDNTGVECRNVGSAPWSYLSHDCCSVCNDLLDAVGGRADMAAWTAERAARPPIEQDRSKLSDEVEPAHEMRAHPLLELIPRRAKR